jgi:hypothetical protein
LVIVGKLELINVHDCLLVDKSLDVTDGEFWA